MVGKIVTLEYLVHTMGWSLQRIDMETRQGTIEVCSIGGGGSTKYVFKKTPLTSIPVMERLQQLSMSRSDVGRLVNKKL